MGNSRKRHALQTRARSDRKDEVFNKFEERYNKGIANGYDLGLSLGNIQHNIQDFYAHSNYVELFVETYRQLHNFVYKMNGT